MSVRTSLVVAASALAAVAFTLPAQADEGVGFGTRFGGQITSSSEDFTPDSEGTIGGEFVAGRCTYSGQTSPTGATTQYEFGGEAVSSSTSQSQPELTAIQCRLVSEAQGIPGERPTLTADSPSVACPGLACATGGTPVLGWPVRPVKICITGFAVFGPTPVVQKYIIPACSIYLL